MSSNSLFLPERFREVAHYIHTHHGKTFVVYLSGNVLSESITLTALIQDLALIHTLGVKLVLVLDLNTLIQQDAKERDSSLSHDNRLLTHPGSIRQAHNAADEMLDNLVALFDASLVNTPLSTIKPKIAFDDFIHIEPSDFRKKKYASHRVKYSIAKSLIQRQLVQNNIIVIVPLVSSSTQPRYLLEGVQVAMHTASVLESSKLILMLKDFRLEDSTSQGEDHYDIHQARRLADELPGSELHAKRCLNIAIQACKENVKRVHLVDAGKPGMLLQELYSLDGAATLVTAQEYDEIRPASCHDIDGIMKLIQPFIETGALVPRSRRQLESEVSLFDVIERDGVLLTCGTLYTFPEENAAEVGCLAVHPEYQSIGRGSKMLRHLQNKACKAGFSKLFVLTTQTENWFLEQGFIPADFEELPVKKRSLYDPLRNSKVYFKTIR